MRYLVTLHLMPEENTYEQIKQLPGLKDLDIDDDYGLVLISPKRKLYTIRVSGELDPEKLMTMQPRVKGVHGDVKISPVGEEGGSTHG